MLTHFQLPKIIAVFALHKEKHLFMKMLLTLQVFRDLKPI